ncbi:hypothetical protein IWQ61_010329, partial [Dispira simplex]
SNGCSWLPFRTLGTWSSSYSGQYCGSYSHRGTWNASSSWYRVWVIGGCATLPLWWHGSRQSHLLCDAGGDFQGSINAAHYGRLLILEREARKNTLATTPVTALSDQPPPKTVWITVWQLVRQEGWLLVAVVVTAVGSALVNLWTPVVMGRLIQVISHGLRHSTRVGGIAEVSPPILRALHRSALKLLALFAAQGVLTAAHIFMVSVLGERVSWRLHHQLFTRFLKQDVAFFDLHRSGELVERLTSDIADFKHTFKQLITQGLKAVTMTVGSISHLFYISVPLTLTLAGTMPLLYVSLLSYGRFLRHLRKLGRKWEGVASGIGMEALSNIRTVRAFAAESVEKALYLDACQRTGALNVLFGTHMGIFRGVTNFSIGSMVLLVLYYGGYLVTRGDLEAGSLMAYMISVQNAQRSLDTLGGMLGQSIRAMASLARVQEYILVQPRIPIEGGIRPWDLQGDIRFQKVNFTYPSRPDQVVLDNFSLHIPAGKVIALCGGSGSGKSTLAALLERFYDPDMGKIYVDGHPLQSLDPGWFRTQVGYINQEPTLFATSILENIRYGCPNATVEQVYKAAKEANAHDFIESFPQRYDTVLGERGVTLSGGQKQRIAIARAILKRPRILILDEATSALDSQSEQLVQEALDKLMHGRTVLVIAHRLSTIRNADQIVVLGKVPGHVLEMGTHAALMKQRGHYYGLYTQSQRDP